MVFSVLYVNWSRFVDHIIDIFHTFHDHFEYLFNQLLREYDNVCGFVCISLNCLKFCLYILKLFY